MTLDFIAPKYRRVQEQYDQIKYQLKNAEGERRKKLKVELDVKKEEVEDWHYKLELDRLGQRSG